MEPFYLHIKNRAGIYIDAIVLFDIFCQAEFILIFNIHKFLAALLILRIDCQLADMGQIRDPLIPYLIGHPLSQKRVAVKQETPLGNSVCLIVEFFRHHLIEIAQFLFLQDFRMEPGYSVYGKSGHNGQMCHLNLAIEDNRHFLYFFIVVRILLPNFQQEAAVDLLHNLVDTRKQPGEQLDRPFFQSLCHDGMVCVGAASRCDIPGVLPLQMFFIQEDSHKLRNRYGRMGIVHLEHYLLRQHMDIFILLFEFFNRHLQAGGVEEVLLLQAQFFAGVVIIIWVENFNKVLRQVFLFHCLLVISLVKGGQAERVNRLRIPDTECVDHVISIAYNRHIIRHCQNGLIAFLDKHIALPVPDRLHITSEFYLRCIFRTAYFEWISVLQPFIRHFDLITVFNFLLEHAVVVADTAAIGRVSKRSKGIQKAGCQTAKTAVAESRIRLLVLDGV